MKIEATREALLALVTAGGSTTPKNSPIPVLSHCRLIARAGTLRIASCDLDQLAEATGPVNVEKAGATTVDAARLRSIVSALAPGASISLTLDGTDLVVKSGRSRVRLATLPAEDFPALKPDGATATFDLSGSQLDRLLGRLSGIASTGSSHMRSAFVHFRPWHERPSLVGVVTNGTVLLVTVIEAPEGADQLTKDRDGRPSVMIAPETVATALRLFKSAAVVKVEASERLISFSTESVSLVAKLIDATFPPYDRIIPFGTPANKIEIARASISSTVSLFESFASKEEGHKLELATSDEGLIIAAGGPNGQGRDVLSAEITGGVDLFGMSSALLKTVLGAFKAETISLSLQSPATPIVFASDEELDTLAVLAPMRVDGKYIGGAE